MKVKTFLRYFGFCLFFGLCITLLSGRAAAFAGENDAKLNVTDVSITKDGSYKLKVYNLTESQTVMYRSGDTEIALVSKTGMVTGRSY
ncbi:MAG: Ig-like domain-containing protein [Lachnospiraceae bacterium]|nr:Ig-like domain-containing protein [Lachnospiraceae bacterium]